MIVRGKGDDAQPVDVVKVCDFGIAKIVDASAPPSDGATRRHTTRGLIVGTPEYMSPEQARGEVLDGRSDLYSVGVVLYELLTGRPPFAGDTPLSIVLKHVSEDPVPPSSHVPSVNLPLEAICMKALQKKASERFQNAREMRVALRSIMGAASAPARSPALLALADTVADRPPERRGPHGAYRLPDLDPGRGEVRWGASEVRCMERPHVIRLPGFALVLLFAPGCAAIDPEVGPSQEACGVDAAGGGAPSNTGYGSAPSTGYGQSAPAAKSQSCTPDAGSACDDCESMYCCVTRLACYSDPVCTCADQAMDLCLAKTSEAGAVQSPQAAVCWNAFSAYGTVEKARVACEQTWCAAACAVQ